MNHILTWVLVVAMLLALGQAPIALADDEVVEVVFFVNNGGVTDSITSDPKVLEDLQQWFIDQIGVKITAIVPPAEEAETKLNLLLVSGAQIDGFWGDWMQYSQLEMIQPITDFYSAEQYPGIDLEFGFAMDQMTDTDGNVWGIPRSFSRAGYPLIWRKDYAEASGYEGIPETLDDLNELLYALQAADPAGNGQTIPLITTGIGSLTSSIAGLFTREGETLWYDETAEKVKLPVVQDGYRDFVAQVQQWYTDGILYSEFFNTNVATLRELTTSGRAASALAWYSSMGIALQNMWLADPDTPAVGARTNFLRDENGRTGQRLLKGSTSGLIFSASSTPEAIEGCLKIVDFQLSNMEARFNATYALDAWEYLEGSTQAAQAKENATNVGTTSYSGEYRVSIGVLRVQEFLELLGQSDARYLESNGETAGYFFYQHYAQHHYDVAVTKPWEYDYYFDTTRISEEVMAYTDVNTKISEELIKFVIGNRPLDQWDAFIQELYDMGMAQVEDAYTAQYLDMID